MALTRFELDRLRGLSPYAQMMYLLVFRQYACVESGLFDRRMSQQAWWEVLSFVPSSGSAADWNSALPEYGKADKWRGWLRNRKEELIRAGLLVKVDAYVFKLPVFEVEGLIRPKQQRTDSARNSARENEPKYLNYNDNELEQRTSETPSSALPSYTTTTTTTASDAFSMSDDWFPAESFADQAAMSGFKVRKGESDRDLMEKAIGNVRMYWQSAKGQHRTENQHGWHLELLRTMRKLQVYINAEKVTPLYAKTKSSGGAKTLKVPYLVGDELVRWAKQIGFRDALAGEEFHSYRQALVNHVGRINSKREQEAFGV